MSSIDEARDPGRAWSRLNIEEESQESNGKNSGS